MQRALFYAGNMKSGLRSALNLSNDCMMSGLLIVCGSISKGSKLQILTLHRLCFYDYHLNELGILHVAEQIRFVQCILDISEVFSLAPPPPPPQSLDPPSP